MGIIGQNRQRLHIFEVLAFYRVCKLGESLVNDLAVSYLTLSKVESLEKYSQLFSAILRQRVLKGDFSVLIFCSFHTFDWTVDHDSYDEKKETGRSWEGMDRVDIADSDSCFYSFQLIWSQSFPQAFFLVLFIEEGF